MWKKVRRVNELEEDKIMENVNYELNWIIDYCLKKEGITATEHLSIKRDLLLSFKSEIEKVKRLTNKNKELDEKVIILEGNKIGYKLAIEEFKKENKKLLLNLENKVKESHLIQSRLDEANAKIIELNKIIGEMAKDIAENKLDEDICRKVKNKTSDKDDCYGDDYDMCKDCVIEFYKKKARDDNG